MKQAVSYSRFSSSGQAKGSSIERQRAMFNEWLALNKEHYVASSLSAQDEGLSAYKKDNLKGGLGDILNAINAGRLTQGDALVVEAIDRLSRAATLDTFKDFISPILNAGIIIITLEDNQEYTKESINSSQAFVLIGKIQAAHDYSKRLSHRVSAAWQRKRENATNNIPPDVIHSYPMWIDKKTKRLNKHAPMIMDIVFLYLSGNGLREICSLISRKYQFPLTDRNIGRWLDNYNAMLGLWNGVQAFEALLTHEKFFEVRDARTQRTRTPKQANFYKTSGLLSCSVCGGSFIFRVQKPKVTKSAPKDSPEYKSKPNIVYGNCRAYLRNKACTNNVCIPEEVALLVYDATKEEALLEIAVEKAIGVLDRRAYAGLIERRRNIDEKYEALYCLATRKVALLKEHDYQTMENLKKELDSLDLEIKKQNQKISESDAIRSKTRSKDIRSTGAREMLSGFGYVDQELIEATEIEMKKLLENQFLTRLALKNSGYRISVYRKHKTGESKTGKGMPLLSVSSEIFRNDSWSILRRSQKLGAYLVEHVWIEEDFEASDEQNRNIYVEKSEILEAKRVASSHAR